MNKYSHFTEDVKVALILFFNINQRGKGMSVSYSCKLKHL